MKKSHAIGIVAAAVLQGGYMLFDGIHKLLTGAYFGGQVGPWARVVSGIGINASSMAPVFVGVGSLWLAAATALVLGFSWARGLLAGLAIVTLAYPLFGTLLSVLVLVLLLTGRANATAPDGKS